MESIFWGSGVKVSCADAAPGIMAMAITKVDLRIRVPNSSQQR